MRDRRVACCPCFETLASLAPQHEVVVFQRVRPHPRVTASPLSLEEATNGSRECAPDDRLRGRLEGWAAIPICDSRYLIMIFSENRFPPSDQVRGHAFPDHARRPRGFTFRSYVLQQQN